MEERGPIFIIATESCNGIIIIIAIDIIRQSRSVRKQANNIYINDK